MTTLSIPDEQTFAERYRDMRWCIQCGGEQVFVPVFECEAGRMGVCLGCGSEKLIPFSRVTNAEAA